MAAKAMKLHSNLIITVKAGLDDKGKEILKKSNLGIVTDTASEQDIFDVAKGIEKVLQYEVDEIQKVDYSVVMGS